MSEMEIKRESARNDNLFQLLQGVLDEKEVRNIDDFFEKLKLFIGEDKSINPAYLSEEDVVLWYKFEKNIISNEDFVEHTNWARKLSNPLQKEASLAMNQHMANMIMVKYGGDWPGERLEEVPEYK